MCLAFLESHLNSACSNICLSKSPISSYSLENKWGFKVCALIKFTVLQLGSKPFLRELLVLLKLLSNITPDHHRVPMGPKKNYTFILIPNFVPALS